MHKIRIGIIGGAGYTAGELIRLLLHHPLAQIVFVQSNSQAGKPISSIHRDLAGEIDMLFNPTHLADVDVLFCCTAHGASKQFFETAALPDGIKVIDLSQDFRVEPVMQGRNFIYGLPELNKTQIMNATSVANPGCFATAIQLGLLPMAQAGLLPQEIHTSGITGSTGAGQSLSETTHFSWRHSNISVYKVFQHQHLSEIYRSLGSMGTTCKLHFVPYRGPFTRGIWITSYFKSDISRPDAVALYKQYYATHPFTHVSDETLDLKQVVGTNKCLIHIEKQGEMLLVYSIIDNLLKGASGQALQNMNLMCGIDEKAGLNLKTIAF
jgi:N-acetyl-gamma-glutamyl-phosphate reductase